MEPPVQDSEEQSEDQTLSPEKASKLTSFIHKLELAQTLVKSQFFNRTLETKWEMREMEQKMVYEMEIKKHASSRIMVEFKRVMHHTLNFGLSRWRLNAEKSRPIEYEYVDESYETTTVEREEQRRRDVEISLAKLSKRFTRFTKKDAFGLWRGSSHTVARKQTKVKVYLKHSLNNGLRTDLHIALSLWRSHLQTSTKQIASTDINTALIKAAISKAQLRINSARKDTLHAWRHEKDLEDGELLRDLTSTSSHMSNLPSARHR
jgi:hypothetical protein